MARQQEINEQGGGEGVSDLIVDATEKLMEKMGDPIVEKKRAAFEAALTEFTAVSERISLKDYRVRSTQINF